MFQLSFRATVPQRQDGTPDIDPISLRRTLADVWDIDPGGEGNASCSTCLLARCSHDSRFSLRAFSPRPTTTGDVLVSVNVVILARKARVLQAMYSTANRLFNMTIQQVDSFVQSCEMFDANMTAMNSSVQFGADIIMPTQNVTVIVTETEVS